MSQDPSFEHERDAERAAEERPDSAEADRVGAAGEVNEVEPQAEAIEKADPPGMDAVHDANARGVDPNR